MTVTEQTPAIDEPADVIRAAPVEPTKVYESSRRGMPQLRPYFRETWERRPFIWHLARTSLKSENYDTAAGQLWIILNPLFMAAVYLLVRSVFRPTGSGQDRADVIDHLVIGVFFFRLASASLNLGATSITSQRQLVLNTAFPRMVFPIAASLQAVMEFLPTLFVIFAFHWYLDQPFTSALFYLPVFFITLLLFNLGMSLFFAPLSVMYTDVKSLVPYINKTWLFTTPVMYSVALIEENVPHLLPWMRLNPLFPWFASFEAIFDGEAPAFSDLLWTVGWAALFLIAGTVLFLRKERFFARRL